MFDLFFKVGVPNGYSTINVDLSFTPELLGLEISQGSEGGATFKAKVSGAGINDSLELID